MTEEHAEAYGGHSREGQLVRMANDIADFFRSQADTDGAVVGIATHLKNFWTRSMLAKLSAYVEQGAPELAGLAREALSRLNAGKITAVPHAGGDAG